MRYISWTWFLYVLIGFLLGGGTVYLWSYLKDKSEKLVWYEVVLFVLTGLAFVLLGQTFIASFQEGEPQAAWLSVVFMGIPMVIMLVGALRSLQSRISTA